MIPITNLQNPVLGCSEVVMKFTQIDDQGPIQKLRNRSPLAQMACTSVAPPGGQTVAKLI
jgi:hypothetical protein